MSLFEEQIVEVDVDTLDFGSVLVVSREPREIVDQRLETTALAHDDLAHFIPVRAIGILRGSFGGREQRGERTSQLVTRVGDELLLELRRGLESIQHGVDRSGHAGDFVLSSGRGHAL